LFFRIHIVVTLFVSVLLFIYFWIGALCHLMCVTVFWESLKGGVRISLFLWEFRLRDLWD